MAILSYAVVRWGGSWSVVGPRGRIGTLTSAERAISLGLRLARQAREAGSKVELLVQNNVGQLLPFDPTFNEETCHLIPTFLGVQPGPAVIGGLLPRSP
jgi:hypothetical protein